MAASPGERLPARRRHHSVDVLRWAGRLSRESIMRRAMRICSMGAVSALMLAAMVSAATADDRKQLAFEVIDRNAQQMTDISDTIYYFGELGMQEVESTKLLKGTLEAAGFKVEL